MRWFFLLRILMTEKWLERERQRHREGEGEMDGCGGMP